MLTPIEMQRTLPMALHGGAKSTTTEVWAMLSASFAGDLAKAQALMAQRPELATCQYNYTPAADRSSARGRDGARPSAQMGRDG